VSESRKGSLRSGKTKNRDLPEILAEERNRKFQKALEESAAQFNRGNVSTVAALKAIYRGR
jgi:hypothetical protein